ncbi:hypothetical protein, partial [Streptomyces sp. 8K308]|uniref:hypothetical protein n=1 Tax=Streptomyces sp. 8K308 TaxID=2530388 RepID=UPI001A9D3955
GLRDRPPALPHEDEEVRSMSSQNSHPQTNTPQPQSGPDRRPELEQRLREANAQSEADRRAKGGRTS